MRTKRMSVGDLWSRHLNGTLNRQLDRNMNLLPPISQSILKSDKLSITHACMKERVCNLVSVKVRYSRIQNAS